MRNWYTGVLAAAGIAAAGLMGAGDALADGELHIYNWGNYTNPKLIEKFEAAHNIKVTIDDYDSNETMLAKVQSGATGYDIVVPGDYMVAIMIKEGLLAETKPNEMSNFGNVDPRWVGRVGRVWRPRFEATGVWYDTQR